MINTEKYKKNTESRKIKSNRNLWIVMNYITDEYKLLN